MSGTAEVTTVDEPVVVPTSNVAESNDVGSPAPKPPQEETDRIRQLLESGDVIGAEAALKALKKLMKKSTSGDSKPKEESTKRERKRSEADGALVIEGDEHKSRRPYEKEQKREWEAIEKLAKESYKLAAESDAKRARDDKLAKDRDERERRDEKRDRDRAEKLRRDIEKLEAEGRKEAAKEERAAFDEIDRHRKLTEKSMRERRPSQQTAAKPKQPAARSLLTFGFSAEKRQATADNEDLLFSQFVPSSRVVPAALCFWSHNAARELCLADSTTVQAVAPMETSCSVPEGFCKEVVFCGFSAIGFEPAQARPSYWGTMNPTLNDVELLSLARYPLGDEMPKLSTLNYDYDSGDDWDVMSAGGDDVDAPSDDESEDESDGESSDDNFIDDEGGGDSDAEHMDSFLGARARRQNRLRGRDRLVPLFSGPFEILQGTSHPLASLSRFHLSSGVSPAFIEETLLQELSRALPAEVVLKPKQSQRRLLQDEEMNEVHAIVLSNPRVSQAALVELIAKRPSFAGIAQAEVRRAIKRWYDHMQGTFVRRDVPWAADDERLFEKKTPKDITRSIEVEKRPRDEVNE